MNCTYDGRIKMFQEIRQRMETNIGDFVVYGVLYDKGKWQGNTQVSEVTQTKQNAFHSSVLRGCAPLL